MWLMDAMVTKMLEEIQALPEGIMLALSLHSVRLHGFLAYTMERR